MASSRRSRLIFTLHSFTRSISLIRLPTRTQAVFDSFIDDLPFVTSREVWFRGIGQKLVRSLPDDRWLALRCRGLSLLRGGTRAPLAVGARLLISGRKPQSRRAGRDLHMRSPLDAGLLTRRLHIPPHYPRPHLLSASRSLKDEPRHRYLPRRPSRPLYHANENKALQPLAPFLPLI